jgi:transcriptional regulator with AAA-type ATPase domain
MVARVPPLSLLVSADEGLVRLPLPQGKRLVLGRRETCDVVLDDDSASRRHAALHVQTGRVLLEDLGSSNGTFLLGRRLGRREKAILPLGAAFDLAGTTLVLHERRKLPAAVGASRARARRGTPLVADPAMARLYALLEVLAPSTADVLVLGETGTGKRMYAEAILARSPRAKGPYVTVDCGTLDKAALTAALEEADRGTILFERVHDLPPALRPKVLGTKRTRAAAPRRIFTAYPEARKLALAFNGFSLEIPPLRRRRDDIAPLARLFATRSAKQLGEPTPELSQQASNALTRHEWPRNVRELQGVMDRAVIDADGAAWIDLEHLRLPRYD